MGARLGLRPVDLGAGTLGGAAHAGNAAELPGNLRALLDAAQNLVMMAESVHTQAQEVHNILLGAGETSPAVARPNYTNDRGMFACLMEALQVTGSHLDGVQKLLCEIKA